MIEIRHPDKTNMSALSFKSLSARIARLEGVKPSDNHPWVLPRSSSILTIYQYYEIKARHLHSGKEVRSRRCNTDNRSQKP